MGANIDALIAAGVRPPQVEDPQTRALRAMQMRDMQQQAIQRGQLAQLAGMRISQAQRDQADDRAIQDALGQTNGDIGQALPMLAGKVGGDAYTKLQNTLLQQTREKLANTRSQDEQAELYHNVLGSAANGVKAAGYTPDSFDAATQLAVALHPQMAGLLNPYIAQARQDPSTIKGMVDQWIAETPTGQRGEAEVRAQKAEARDEEMQPFRVSEAGSRATEAAQKAAGTEPITRYQQQMLDIEKQRDADMNWYRRQEVAQGWKRLADNGSGVTPNSREVTRRLQMKQLDDLIDQEASLHKLRLQLGNAIANGSVYVDEKGNLKPMDAASASNDQTKAALMQEMKDRFSQATTDVNDVIARKNALGSQLGMQPRVSTGQAQGAVSRGARPQQPAGQQPQRDTTRIRVRLQNGRTGTVEAWEFDPNTMSRQ